SGRRSARLLHQRDRRGRRQRCAARELIERELLATRRTGKQPVGAGSMVSEQRHNARRGQDTQTTGAAKSQAHATLPEPVEGMRGKWKTHPTLLAPADF